MKDKFKMYKKLLIVVLLSKNFIYLTAMQPEHIRCIGGIPLLKKNIFTGSCFGSYITRGYHKIYTSNKQQIANNQLADAACLHLNSLSPQVQEHSFHKIKTLLEQKANPEITLYLDHPSDLGEDDYRERIQSSLLYAATYANRNNLVRALVHNKADVNRRRIESWKCCFTSPFERAVACNFTDIAFYLLQNGCKVENSYNITSRLRKHNNIPLTKKLLEQGILFEMPGTLVREKDDTPAIFGNFENDYFIRAILCDEYDAHHRQKNNEYRNDVQKFLTSPDNNHPHLPAALGDTIVLYLPPLYRYALPDTLPTQEPERIKAISHMLWPTMFPLQRPPSALER